MGSGLYRPKVSRVCGVSVGRESEGARGQGEICNRGTFVSRRRAGACLLKDKEGEGEEM